MLQRMMPACLLPYLPLLEPWNGDFPVNFPRFKLYVCVRVCMYVPGLVWKLSSTFSSSVKAFETACGSLSDFAPPVGKQTKETGVQTGRQTENRIKIPFHHTLSETRSKSNVPPSQLLQLQTSSNGKMLCTLSKPILTRLSLSNKRVNQTCATNPCRSTFFLCVTKHNHRHARRWSPSEVILSVCPSLLVPFYFKLLYFVVTDPRRGGLSPTISFHASFFMRRGKLLLLF